MRLINDLPEGSDNIGNINMNTVFVDYQNYDFHLLPGSPAIGTGQYGVDMGIYSSSTPFVDDDAPGPPSIFEIQTDYVGSKMIGLDVKIKAKSNKE